MAHGFGCHPLRKINSAATEARPGSLRHPCLTTLGSRRKIRMLKKIAATSKNYINQPTMRSWAAGILVLFAISAQAKVFVNDCTECDTNGECKSALPSDSTTHYCQCQNGYTGNGTYCEDVDECLPPYDNDCHQDADCKNIPGSYTCICNTMFRGNGTYCEASTCENSNPCDVDTSECSLIKNAFQCTCKEGYTGSLACVDVDECLTKSNDCHNSATCTNNVGSYKCTCNTMFLGNGTYCEAKTCENANPCGSRSECSLNSAGTSFSCSCKNGFAGLNCNDINECAATPCPSDATCVNSFGSYECQCNSGFYFDGLICQRDVDECNSTGLNGCHERAICTNTMGSYNCSCETAYRGNGTHCEDIDECSTLDLNDCHKDASCVNSDGSYKCICNTMFRGNGSYCEATTCENSKPCGENSECSLAQNAFQCTCKEGYTGGLSCVDVDECTAAKLNDCHSHATCTNTIGSYKCTCNTMYRGNGTFCEAKTCENANPCGQNSICSLVAAAFECSCSQGYAGLNCVDINECVSSPCDQHATCTNIPGSHTCQCNPSYTGNGTFCADIDECSSESLNDCHNHATCTNTIGSYKCTCNTMYRGNGTFCEVKTCENANPCGQTSICSLTKTAFECSCSQGYAGLNCLDINECDASPCDQHATCINTPGSYTCQCESSYAGNGTFCAECPTCPKHSTCKLNDKDEADCPCNNAYKKRDDGCFGLCEGKQWASNGETYTFNDTWVGDVTFATEKCPNGRSKASVTCIEIGGIFTFNDTTFHEIACNETMKSVSVKIDWGEAEGDVLEEGVSQLNILVSAAADLSQEDRRQFLSIVDISTSSLVNKSNAVTLQTLREVVVAANSVTESIKATLRKQSDPDSGKNETLVKEGQVLVKALQIFAAKVSVTQDVVTVTTVNIRAEVKSRLSPNSSKYNYESESLKISVPREALDQANIQTNEEERIVFIEYIGNTLFQTTEHIESVITVEIGINVAIKNLTNKLEFTGQKVDSSATKPQPIPGTTQMLKAHPKCTYYVPENLTFSTEGCCLVRNTTPPTCKCNHMTSFAVLVEHETVDRDIALSIVTTVGCVISASALVLTIALHLVDRCKFNNTKRQRTLTIHLHICVCLLGVYLTFLIGVSQTQHEHVCTAISAVLHYLLLVTFCWTTVYSFTAYMTVSKGNADWSGKYFVKKSAAFVYGIPLAAVLVIVLVHLGEKQVEKSESLYCKDNDNANPPISKLSIIGYRAPHMCWLTGDCLKFGFLLPAAIMLLINYIFFTFFVYLLTNKPANIKKAKSRKNARQEITLAASMATTLGLTWGFGYLMLISTDLIYRNIMAWLFTITNVLQGLLLFALTIVIRVKLRERIYSSVKSRFTSISGGVTSRVRSATFGKSYVVNRAFKSDESPSDSTTDSSSNIENFRSSVLTTVTALPDGQQDLS